MPSALSPARMVIHGSGNNSCNIIPHVFITGVGTAHLGQITLVVRRQLGYSIFEVALEQLSFSRSEGCAPTARVFSVCVVLPGYLGVRVRVLVPPQRWKCQKVATTLYHTL